MKSKRKRLHDRCMEKFSKIIRLKYADNDGYVRCYTCPTVKHWKDMHAGHFKHGRLDFDSDNRRPQCSQCNRWKRGKLDVFADNLREELGRNRYNMLIARADRTRKMTEWELDLLNGVLRKQLKKLMEEKL